MNKKDDFLNNIKINGKKSLYYSNLNKKFKANQESGYDKGAEEEKETPIRLEYLILLNKTADYFLEELENYRINFRDKKGNGFQRESKEFKKFEKIVDECQNLQEEVTYEFFDSKEEYTHEIRNYTLTLIEKLQMIQVIITKSYSIIYLDEQNQKHKMMKDEEDKMKNFLMNVKEENSFLKTESNKIKTESNKIKDSIDKMNISTISVMGIFVCIFSLVNVNMSYFKALIGSSDNILKIIAFFLIINGTAICSLVSLFNLVYKFVNKNSDELTEHNCLMRSIFKRVEYGVSLIILLLGVILLWLSPKENRKNYYEKEITNLVKEISILKEKIELIENSDSKVSINYYKK